MREGVVMISGKICWIVFSSVVKAVLSIGETGEGSCAKPVCEIFTRSSAMVLITYCFTDSIVSPGRILKLTIAVAVDGNTFSFTPARKIVGAVVVRIVAFPEFDFSYL